MTGRVRATVVVAAVALTAVATVLLAARPTPHRD
jgi:hypothetical protein